MVLLAEFGTTRGCNRVLACKRHHCATYLSQIAETDAGMKLMGRFATGDTCMAWAKIESMCMEK